MTDPAAILPAVDLTTRPGSPLYLDTNNKAVTPSFTY